MKTKWVLMGWSLAVGLGLAVGQALAADNSAWSRAHGGVPTGSKAVFAEPLMLTSPPAALATPDQLGPLVDPRLVTPSVGPLPGGPAGTAPGSTPAASLVLGPLDNKYKLLEGDQLYFRVLEDQEDRRVLTVSDAGDLDVPELGLVTAKNKTCKELAAEIKRKLEQTTYFQATVILGIDRVAQQGGGRRIYVGGLVQRAGQQEIPPGEPWTVTKAIMRAGGFTQYANKHKVKVVRAGKKGAPTQTFVVNVAAVLEKGRTEQDVAVEAEDFIWVPPQGINF